MLLEKKIPIKVFPGIFGYVILQRLPAEMWTIVKRYGTYHYGNNEDIEWAEEIGIYNVSKHDLKGWFYSEDAIDALLKAGYPVEYKGVAITTIADLRTK